MRSNNSLQHARSGLRGAGFDDGGSEASTTQVASFKKTLENTMEEPQPSADVQLQARRMVLSIFFLYLVAYLSSYHENAIKAL